ncbi:MAG: hypothetical protein ACXVEF_02595 [Polyangiales bacterium]
MSAADVENAHAILRKALRELAPEHVPDPPYHAGGPLLTCPALDQIRISLWCAELLDARAKQTERAEMKAIADLVQKFLRAPLHEADDRAMYGELSRLSNKAKKDSAALACMRAAASGSSVYMRGKADLVFSSATASVMRTVKELVEDPRPMTARAFLEALDLRLMIAELNGAYREKIKGEPLSIERVLYRSGDANGKMACWIARLEGGTYGFLGRLGEGPRPKWSFISGSRDHVLASVPDDRFAEAAAKLGSNAS